ncbi:glycerate kinase [Mariprofundus erugo]|uniref:glycerate kinase n=1 Tax=Mariprofundus erugo TaxID=2528639 RepID=UPI0010FE4DFD|nr:glycerate kinase [Mariprofundus erugo]TLS73620.1 glycerate kinase [Mariprofundus erugo]
MRILIAPDSFKGTLTAPQVAAVMAQGMRQICAAATLRLMPLADGGEGTRDVLMAALDGFVREGVGYFDMDGRRHAVIESALWIGLHAELSHRPIHQRGTSAPGEMVKRLLDEGIRDIWLALGGSGTCDGGLGMLQALGCRAYDQKGQICTPDLAGMMAVRQLDAAPLDHRLQSCRLTALVDVDNPLYGEQGAVYTYAVQKGLDMDELEHVDLAMQCWADLCERVFRCKVAGLPGAGAAGGLGFALKLLGAAVVPGGAWVLRQCGFDRLLNECDWVVTGEGRSDLQTLHGKLPLIVAQQARQAGVRSALISGDVTAAQALAREFDQVISVRPQSMTCANAMARAESLLLAATARWMASKIPVQS